MNKLEKLRELLEQHDIARAWKEADAFLDYNDKEQGDE